MILIRVSQYRQWALAQTTPPPLIALALVVLKNYIAIFSTTKCKNEAPLMEL